MLSFGQALEKVSYRLNLRGKAEVKAQKHFDAADPNWSLFEKNLRSKTFQDVVQKHPQADEKLQRYVKSYGGYLTSKDTAAVLKSPDSGKVYKLKRVDGRIACGCKDWQYKKSHGGGDCKHIRRYKEKTKISNASALLQLYKHPEILGDDAVKLKRKAEKKVEKVVPLAKAKEAFVSDMLTHGAGIMYANARAKKQHLTGQAASMNAKMLKTQEQQKG